MAVEQFNVLVNRKQRVNTGYVHENSKPLFIQLAEYDESDNQEWGVVQWVSSDSFIDGKTVVFESKILFNNTVLFYPSVDFVPSANIWVYLTKSYPGATGRIKGWTFT